jgi:1,4-alpha-glucan branching enzyme
MAQGYLCLILHAHLPYVRHPEHESFLEESWLFEAITETYIPLINAFDRLLADGIRFSMTMSLSPTLAAMLQDEFLQSRYLAHMSRLCELADREVERTRNDPRFHHLACMYKRMFAQAVDVFENRYGRDLVRAFRKFQEAGVLEIMTCAATHGFLPLLQTEPSAVRAQVAVGAQSYRRAFGRDAAGMWLPECGYYPGLEEVLADAGIRYFIAEAHAVENASVRLHHGILAPIACPNGVAAFGRDAESSKQVWSSAEGYPGDADYREFYRDIGFDLDFQYVKPYILDGQTRVHTGIKYYRVTGRTDHKEPYDPARAKQKAAQHAGNFMFWRERQIEYNAPRMGRPPIIVAPYDAELFGHWWFEGPQWLEFLIRKITFDQKTVELITPSQYLARHRVLQKAVPSASSWGYKGYNEFWLNGGNDWVHPHLRRAARRMRELVRAWRTQPTDGLTERALKQAGRSLLLAQASDWPFIMRSGTTVEYANRRIRDHLARFNYLDRSLEEGRIDERRLQCLEAMDNIFPELDVAVFA